MLHCKTLGMMLLQGIMLLYARGGRGRTPELLLRGAGLGLGPCPSLQSAKYHGSSCPDRLTTGTRFP